MMNQNINSDKKKWTTPSLANLDSKESQAGTTCSPMMEGNHVVSLSICS